MTRTAGAPVRVLHVDDDPDLAEATAVFLEREHEALEVVTETSAADGRDRLATGDIDCVVSDYDMPRVDGLEFLEAVRTEYPDLPFILYTGKGSEEIASDAISAGVTDYLQKGGGTDQYALLANRIERAVAENRAKDALAESERMFSTLISNLPGMVYRARNEPDWPMEFVSEGCLPLTGYDSEQLERGAVEWGPDVVHPDDAGTLWDTVQDALAAREPFALTYRIVTADGDVRWVWERGRGVFEDGDLVALEGFVTDVTERRAAEQSRRKYETIVESMEDAAYVLDSDGTFEFVNGAFVEATGLDAEAVLGADSEVFAELTAATARDRYRTLVEEFCAGERTRAEVEFDIEDGEGEMRTVDLRLTRLEDDGTFEGIIGIARDVTERRERERELERYRTLVDDVGDPIYVLDERGYIEVANRAMADQLGYDVADLVGTHASEVVADGDFARGTEVLRDLLADGERHAATFEMHAVRHDGTEIPCEDKVTPITDEDGRYAGSAGVVRDISERKARERDLERYETVVQAVGDPVYALDADGHYTFINEAMAEVIGREPPAVVGEHVSLMIDEADIREGERLIRELLRSDERSNATYEMDMLPPDGEPIPSENHLALLPFDDDGEFRGTAGVVRDISERKERERRLEQFASVVSHDLRNPLNVIDGRIEMARRTGDLDNLDAASDSVERMRRLIDDLLTLARQGDTVGETHTVDVATLAERAWAQVDTAGASLDTADPGTVAADRERLLELLENLVRNAVEHAGGDVTVRVGSLPDGEGFYVADDGSGIPDEVRDEVFERGYSTAADGTGFGLNIVRRIARAHDWEVRIADSWADGTRFEIDGSG